MPIFRALRQTRSARLDRLIATTRRAKRLKSCLARNCMGVSGSLTPVNVVRSIKHSVGTAYAHVFRHVLPYSRREENNAYCFDENNEVKEQRLVLDVVEIVRQLLTRVLH